MVVHYGELTNLKIGKTFHSDKHEWIVSMDVSALNLVVDTTLEVTSTNSKKWWWYNYELNKNDCLYNNTRTNQIKTNSL